VKTVVLIDPYQGGHHLMYLRLFSKTILELGYQVVACSADSENLDNWIVAQLHDSPELIKNFKTLTILEHPAKRLFNRNVQPLNTLSRWYHAKKTIRQVIQLVGHHPNLVLFNWVDSYLSRYIPASFIDIIFPYPWFGICFQPKLGDEQKIKYSHFFDFHRVFKAFYCQGVGVLDDEQTTKLQLQLNKKVITFPDITDEVNPDVNFFVALDIKRKARGRKIIGLLGSLNKRKGLLNLLKASQQSGNEKYFFAFVGQLSHYMLQPEELEYIQKIRELNPLNCYFHFELIPDEPQFNALVNTCDILFAAYENFPYSSNILTKAAVFKKPLIATRGSCVGNRVRQFQMGLTIEEGSLDQCIEAIHVLCDDLDLSLISLEPDFENYRKIHSNAQVFCVFQSLLESNLTSLPI
jgi:glycosyltransferase involved in cell wall biosynthesis